MSFLSWEQSQQIKKWNEREAQLKKLKAENERLRNFDKVSSNQLRNGIDNIFRWLDNKITDESIGKANRDNYCILRKVFWDEFKTGTLDYTDWKENAEWWHQKAIERQQEIEGLRKAIEEALEVSNNDWLSAQQVKEIVRLLGEASSKPFADAKALPKTTEGKAELG